jgi:hypothetical protein
MGDSRPLVQEREGTHLRTGERAGRKSASACAAKVYMSLATPR